MFPEEMPLNCIMSGTARDALVGGQGKSTAVIFMSYGPDGTVTEKSDRHTDCIQ